MAFAQVHKNRPLSVNSLKNQKEGAGSSPSQSPSNPIASCTPSHTRTKSASPITSTSSVSTTSTRRQSNGSLRQSHDGGGTAPLPALSLYSVHVLSHFVGMVLFQLIRPSRTQSATMPVILKGVMMTATKYECLGCHSQF